MAYFSTYTGDTLTFYAPLIDDETKAPVDAADVALVEVKLNGTVELDSSSGTDVLVDQVEGKTSAIVSVSAADTATFSGYVPVTLRVTLQDGRVTTVSNGTILFTKTQIS